MTDNALKGNRVATDLKAISNIRAWSKHDEFTKLECLLDHLLIDHFAEEPKGLPERINALKGVLLEVVERIERREKIHPPDLNRRVAFAGSVFLRLESYENKTLEEIRARVAEKWKSTRSKKPTSEMSPDSLRQIENKEVFLPLATEFEAYALEWAKEMDIDPSDLYPNASFGATMEVRVARRLQAIEEATYQKRLLAIENDGMLDIRTEDEMLEVLLMVTDMASHSFKAVDHTPIREWFAAPRLREYLRHQLKRVEIGPVTLERIYIVDEKDMDDASFRTNVKEFIGLHEGASATVRLCPRSVAESLECSFQPHRGLFLADSGGEPLAVTGKLGAGSVGRAVVHLRENADVRTLREEYELIAEEVSRGDHDCKLRERLVDPG
jgi:hypothetical protein